jgi:hypothetical protein
VQAGKIERPSSSFLSLGRSELPLNTVGDRVTVALSTPVRYATSLARLQYSNGQLMLPRSVLATQARLARQRSPTAGGGGGAALGLGMAAGDPLGAHMASTRKVLVALLGSAAGERDFRRKAEESPVSRDVVGKGLHGPGGGRYRGGSAEEDGHQSKVAAQLSRALGSVGSYRY